jgi:hypothetical protein
MEIGDEHLGVARFELRVARFELRVGESGERGERGDLSVEVRISRGDDGGGRVAVGYKELWDKEWRVMEGRGMGMNGG